MASAMTIDEGTGDIIQSRYRADVCYSYNALNMQVYNMCQCWDPARMPALVLARQLDILAKRL